MKREFVFVFFVLVLAVGLIGCSSKEEPLEVLNKYYDNIKSNNLDENYDYLSSASQNIWTKEKYKNWESICKETCTIKDVKIEKANEYKDKELDGIKYQNVIEYNITEFDHDNYNDKDINSNHVVNVVNENGQWKIYRGEEEPEKEISGAKFILASMYFYGKGKNKDLDKTKNILNESIQENPKYSESHFLLGYMYIELQKYDEAIEILQQYIDIGKSNEEKSEGYVILGLAYIKKNNFCKAKECYTQAIEVNPSNEIAKDTLAKINLESE